MTRSLFFGLFFLVGFFYGQQPKGKMAVTLNKDSIAIGQSILLQIAVESPGTIVFPKPSNDWMKNIEVLSCKTDTIAKDTFVHTIEITSFEPGNYLLKTLAVAIDRDSVRTPSYKIHVQEVAIDSTDLSLAPIKPILKEEYSWLDYFKKYWIYALTFLMILLILLIIGILYFVQNKKNTTTKSKKTPYNTAIGKLAELEKSDFLQNGKTKKYYSALDAIWKNYYGEIKKIRAKKLLSNELFNHMQQSKEFGQSQLSSFQLFLKDADGVKYAKANPSIEQSKLHKQLILRLVEQIKPILVDEEEMFNQRKIKS